MTENTIQPATAAAPPVETPDSLQPSKATVLALLKEKGIATVTAKYCGSDDDGQIRSVEAFDAENHQVHLDTKCTIKVDGQTYTSLQGPIANFCWRCVCTHHDGFWNDDGGDGAVRITVATGEVKIHHTDRFVSTDYSETEV